MKWLIKLLRYLFFPGLLLGAAGLAIRVAQGEWTMVAQVIGGIGLGLLITWLCFWLSSSGSFWRRRSTQAGTNAIAATLSVFVILGLVNYVTANYTEPIDLSENQVNTLSTQSQTLVGTLEQPLKVWIFQDQLDSASSDLLKNFGRYSEQFSFETVNPQVQINLVQEFNVQSIGDVFVEYDGQTQLAQTISQFQPLNEADLSAAIAKALKAETPRIYYVQGHGEPELAEIEGGLSQAQTGLENLGYKLIGLNLVQESSVPADAQAVMLVGPQKSLLEKEVKALQTYLDQGGRMLMLLNPQTDPGVDPLLADWGLELDERLIIDPSSLQIDPNLGPVITVILNYGEHPITQEFDDTRLTLFPFSRAIASVEKEDVEDTIAILVTEPEAWAEKELTEGEELTFDELTDIQGPLDLGVALTKTVVLPESSSETSEKSSSQDAQGSSGEPDSDAAVNGEQSEAETGPNVERDLEEAEPNERTEEGTVKTESSDSEISDSETADTDNPGTDESNADAVETAEDNNAKEARLVVIGNATFATNGWYQQTFNSDIFLNSVKWLSGDGDETLTIQLREAENRRLTLSGWQGPVIFFGAIAVAPLLGLVAALFTWLRRR
ncbi:MAG: Gldg family protein [Cyanobacteria bacterium P01_H01_bin.15]